MTELSDASVQAIHEAAIRRLREAYSLLIDYFDQRVPNLEDGMLLIALDEILRNEDTTCSMVDLLAPDYPLDDTNGIQRANRKTAWNYLRVNFPDWDIKMPPEPEIKDLADDQDVSAVKK